MATLSSSLPNNAAMDQLACPACAARLEIDRMLFDDRYGYPGHYKLLICGACGHRTLDVRMDPQQISDMYTQYYPRSNFNVEAWSPPREESALQIWWHGLRASAFRWVPRNVRVLDIGCGFGESLGYHRARGCEACGVETDRNILRVAERHGLDVKVGLFDSHDYAPASFDVVTLDQVIEHIGTPQTVLQGVHRVLKPGGMLVLSTPNANGWGAKLFGRRWIHWHAPYHVQFFSRSSMARLAGQTGFLLERCSTVTNSAWLGYQWGHLVTYSSPSRPSPYWSTSTRRSIGERVALRLFWVIDRAGINALLTRLMDWLGRGDNVVYLLRKRSA